MKKIRFGMFPILLSAAVFLTNVPTLQAAPGNTADTSQEFTVGNLPDAIKININTTEQDTADTQPRLKYLTFTGLSLAPDGKTVDFNIDNAFNLPKAKPILLGGLMLSAKVRYEYDDGEKLHTCILMKDRKVVLEKGITSFQTDPATYPLVTKIEKLQIFIMPPKDKFIRQKERFSSDVANTSQQFSVDNLPDLITVDRTTVNQNAAQRDPRLEYLKIAGLKVAADGKTVEFSVENTFNRQKQEPIHVGTLMLTGKARYAYDGGAELHNTVLFSQRQVTFNEGSNLFTTDPSLYPDVTKLESLQFFLTPK